MTIDAVSIKQSVKAIIYRKDGKILMQQRDYSDNLPFPGMWTFFGGAVNKNENLKNGLKRELKEELNFFPKKIDKKLFLWKWKSSWYHSNNHFFPVFYDGRKKLTLKEGISMKWFSLEDYIKNPTAPDVYENFNEIYNFLLNKKYIKKTELRNVEKNILVFGNFIKKNNRVYYSSQNICDLSRQEIFLLKNIATLRKERIFRICMHNNDESQTHEMLIMHIFPVKVGPLKQKKSFLSYHIIEGEIFIKTYDNNGNKKSEHQLSICEGSQFLRLEADKYRSITTLSPFAIFLEVANGPFKDDDTIWYNPNSHISLRK